MSTVVIDLYDSCILISDGKRILANSAACALVESTTSILTGKAAEQQVYMRPQEISTRFWAELSARSTTKHVVSHAEIALRHMQFAWSLLDRQDHTAILAVSGTLSKQDLGLVLGICEKLPIPVLGIVNKAVLAVPGPVTNGTLVWLDVMQQCTVLTKVSQDRKKVSASRPAKVLPHGLQSLDHALAKWIAGTFIAETRFDPLQKAEDEQRFYEKLPEWLATLGSIESVGCELHSAGQGHRIQLHRKDVLAINRFIFEKIAMHLNDLFPDGKVGIVCSPTCNQVFGLDESLKDLPGCATLNTDPTGIARQALQYQEQIGTEDTSVHYMTSLTWDRKTRSQTLETNTGSLAILSNCPTHLLVDSCAWPLGQEQEVRLLKDHNTTRLTLDPACKERGVCKISRIGLRIEIRLLKDHRVKLNGRPLTTPRPLQVGDRLDVDGHWEEVRFIKVPDHETPVG